MMNRLKAKKRPDKTLFAEQRIREEFENVLRVY